MDTIGDQTLPTGPAQPTYTVEVNGPYGTVLWTVDKGTWDILPVIGRTDALEAAGRRVIDPFFRTLTGNLLVHVGKNSNLANGLNRESSLEEITAECTFGSVVWQFSQGLWDNLPAGSRVNLLELVEGFMHGFFHEKVQTPLWQYALRKLMP